MTDIDAEKSRLRAKHKSLRDRMDKAERDEIDRRITCNLLSLPVWEECDVLFCYVSFGSEVSTDLLIDSALRRGKIVACPVSLPGGAMEFRSISSPGELVPGRYGISEPPEGAPICIPTARSICCVPAYSFDLRGMRLGYGGGYYDRFLKDYPGCSVGLCRSDFLCDALPCGEHDIPVDIIVTESGSIDPAKQYGMPCGTP